MAGTCAFVSAKDINDSYGRTVGRVVEVLCTHHTDKSLSADLDATTMKMLGGTKVYRVKSIPSATTAPSDATDLSIVDSDGLSLMGTTDNGANFIDATSTLETMLYNAVLTASEERYIIEGETLTIATANNDVASAIFTLKFYCLFGGM